MVVQRDAAMPVWGTGTDGDTVAVAFGGVTQRAVVHRGAWRVRFDNPTPDSLLIAHTSTHTDTIRNIAIGQVWLMLGDYRVSGALGDSGAVNDAEYEPLYARDPRLRFRQAGSSRWLVADSSDAPRLSAVAYYTSDALVQLLNQPVGIVVLAADSPDIGEWTKSRFVNEVAPIACPSFQGVFVWQQFTRPQFTALTTQWRSVMRDSLPFIYLACPNGGVSSGPDKIGPYPPQDVNTTDAGVLARMRDPWQSQTIAHTRMITTNDLPYEEYPKEKSEYGNRLCCAAMDMVYDFSITWSGPIYQSFVRDGSRLIVSFISTGGGLRVFGGGELQGFQIAGADGRFFWANAEIGLWPTVVVSHDSVAAPVRVRYAPGSVTDTYANLGSIQDYGASPFDSDWGSLESGISSTRQDVRRQPVPQRPSVSKRSQTLTLMFQQPALLPTSSWDLLDRTINSSRAVVHRRAGATVTVTRLKP